MKAVKSTRELRPASAMGRLDTPMPRRPSADSKCLLNFLSTSMLAEQPSCLCLQHQDRCLEDQTPREWEVFFWHS